MPRPPPRPSGMDPRWMLALAAAAWVACASVAPAGQTRASRFLPWKDPRTPALALNDLAGKPVTLAEYRGQVVLVTFWATWCEPCRDEMPSMQKLKERLAGRPFAILAVNYGESEAKVSEFLRRVPVDFRVLLDPNQQAPRAWKVRLLPASFLVDGSGRLRYGVIGEVDWTSDDAVNAVAQLMPG